MKRLFNILLWAITATCINQDLQGQEQSCVGIEDEGLQQLLQQRKEQYLSSAQFRMLQQKNASKQLASHTLFRWPLRVSANYDWVPNYFEITNYTDRTAGSGIQDYQCNARTYNGHNGIDISLYPFWWHMMDNNYVYAVAAAPGIVTWVRDSLTNDHNCSCMGSNNGITILHSDSSMSTYFHIQTGSAQVQQGDYVTEGTLIARVGSSGCSSNPHLHFEVRDKTNAVIEPFEGSCNNTTTDSWWQDQRPYWEPQINRVMTHSGDPTTNFCPAAEDRKAKNQFSPGELVYTGVAFRDIEANSSAASAIYYPNGSLWSADLYMHGGTSSSRFYYTFIKLLPFDAPVGTYKIVVSYKGITYNHYFTVGCTNSYTINGASLSGNNGFIAASTIQSNTTLNNVSKTLFQAGNSITLNPGFTAVQGSTLKARIKNCNFSE